MKRFEDIIRESLEGYESSLPEGAHADFRAKLEKSGRPERRKSPWLWMAAPALAAAVALILVVGKHSPQVEPVDVLVKAPVAETVMEPVLEETVEPLLESATQVTAAPAEPLADEEMPVETAADAVFAPVPAAPVPAAPADSVADDTPPLSPFVPDKAMVKNNEARFNFKPAAKGLIGTGVTAALLAGLSSGTKSINAKEWAGGLPIYQTENIPNSPTIYNNQSDYKEKPVAFPVRLAFSLRIPLSGRFSYTTGVDYAGYLSSYSGLGLPASGDDIKHIYLSIPARIDYTLLHRSWFDIYAGAGASATFCTLVNPHRLPDCSRDGVAFSILGTAGAQLNLTDHLGVFLEPEASWTIPSETRKWEPYCSENPYIFSLSTGIRVTIGKINNNNK